MNLVKMEQLSGKLDTQLIVESFNLLAQKNKTKQNKTKQYNTITKTKTKTIFFQKNKLKFRQFD
jgi:hypothetical protein